MGRCPKTALCLLVGCDAMGLSLHSAAVTGLLFGAALWLAVMARHRRRAAQHLGHLPADPLKTLLQRGAADDENIIASRREQLQQRGGNMAEDPLDAVTLYRMAELFGSRKADAHLGATPARKAIQDKS